MDGPIKSILLCEFHHVNGPRISCQVPEGYISKEIFHAVNVYIIPKPKTLQRCILTVNAGALKYKIIGYPVRIDDHKKYARNAYHFNLCFVFSDDWNTSVHYENTVKKLAEYLLLLEDEDEFLSQDQKNNTRIRRILETTLRDLNEKHETRIVEGETMIFLKVVLTQADPPPVHDHEVPQLDPSFTAIPLESWDLTTQQILPYINGYNHVDRIAREAGVDLGLVKSCIQNLVYYKVVQLLPLIKYSNVYMCTRNLQKLVKDPQLYFECRDYVAIREEELEDSEPPDGGGGGGVLPELGNGENDQQLVKVNGKQNPPAVPLAKPTLQRIFQLYSSMSHGQTLKSLCQRYNIRGSHIDERRLVAFGLMHNLIRTVNKYPVFIGSVPSERQKLYNGSLSLDEICCRTGLSPASIEEDINMDTNVTVLWK